MKLTHSVLPTAVSLTLSQRHSGMSYDLHQGSPWCLEQGHREEEQSEQRRGLRVNISFRAQELIPLSTWEENKPSVDHRPAESPSTVPPGGWGPNMGKLVNLLDHCSKWLLTTAVDLCTDLSVTRLSRSAHVSMPLGDGRYSRPLHSNSEVPGWSQYGVLWSGIAAHRKQEVICKSRVRGVWRPL